MADEESNKIEVISQCTKIDKKHQKTPPAQPKILNSAEDSPAIGYFSFLKEGFEPWQVSFAPSHVYVSNLLFISFVYTRPSLLCPGCMANLRAKAIYSGLVHCNHESWLSWPVFVFLQVLQLINSDFFPLVISGMLLERQESLGDVNPISKGSLAGEFK